MRVGGLRKSIKTFFCLAFFKPLIVPTLLRFFKINLLKCPANVLAFLPYKVDAFETFIASFQAEKLIIRAGKISK
jgi:hypothetical protein